MQVYKKILGLLLSASMIFSNIAVVYADDTDDTDTETDEIVEQEENTDTAEVDIDDLNVQLNDLYHEMGDKLNIDYMYIKMMHMICGGKAIYAEELPNIYVDTTVESLDAPFDYDGVQQSYDLIADWIVCADDTVNRPNKYYLPDAAYNVATTIVNMMNSRYSADRGNAQVYFDALNNEVKTTIIFVESMLKYTGSSQETVDNFLSIYEQMLYKKSSNDNVLESDENGNFTFKNEYLSVLKSNGITEDRELNILSIILRFDNNLAASESNSDIVDSYIFPYIVNYPTRENMMLAAMSLVGKVRYVWGGGHLESNRIQGINPMWRVFCNSYSNDPEDESYSKSVKPTTSWCPIHGEVDNCADGCLNRANVVYSVDQYLDERADCMDVEQFRNDNFYRLLENSGIQHGVNSHRYDGLDCSGFASWLYNQVTDQYTYDSGALKFTKQYGVKSLGIGEDLLPGDVFTWGSHIVVIVGKVANNSKAYVTIEATPDVLRFGVVYYSGALALDISKATEIAMDANILLGGIDGDDQYVKVYNMDTLVWQDNSTTTIETVDEDGNIVEKVVESEWNNFHDCGRMNIQFLDENTILSDYNKKIKNMTAQEIIQHTIDNLPLDYVSGADMYKGSLFTVNDLFSNYEAEVIEVESVDASVNSQTMLNNDLGVVLDANAE